MDDPSLLNREHWDERADLHGRGDDRFYDQHALIEGRYDLGDHELAAVERAVGDVAGLDVMHLQCHLAFDAIALARRGARVTGVDFSPVALARAAGLAQRCGVELELVEADSRHLPPALHGRFDVVYATIGVLGLDRRPRRLDGLGGGVAPSGRPARAGGAAPAVPRGRLGRPAGVDFPYADAGPQRFDDPGSYAAPGFDTEANVTIEWAHSIGEVVTAALGAGLTVVALGEHLDAHSSFRSDLLPGPDEDGRYRLRIAGQPLPLLYSLVAERPASASR